MSCRTSEADLSDAQLAAAAKTRVRRIVLIIAMSAAAAFAVDNDLRSLMLKYIRVS